jgi:hypothetical protein
LVVLPFPQPWLQTRRWRLSKSPRRTKHQCRPERFGCRLPVAAWFTTALQIDTSSTANTGDQANALVKAVSEDETLKTALQQFDEGLKKLTLRPETQIFQARFGADAEAANNNVNANLNDLLPSPEPLPGVGKDGLLGACRRRIAKWLPTPITTARSAKTNASALRSAADLPQPGA